MIKKEIKPDNTFGGNFTLDLNYTMLPERTIEITENQRDYIDANIDKFVYDENLQGIWDSPKGVVNISNTDEYKTKLSKIEKQTIKDELNAQIEVLDTKRIRAIAEPSIKEPQSGQTWLEYYTEQIKNLRNQINSL